MEPWWSVLLRVVAGAAAFISAAMWVAIFLDLVQWFRYNGPGRRP